MTTHSDQPVLTFETPAAWRDWLAHNHAASGAVWLRLFKKGSGPVGFTYADALDEALCYGWIDSTKGKYDEASYVQRFGPRKARSLWSKVNREHVARLIAEGRMTPAGQAHIDAAKANGQWEAAYDAFSRATVPEDFQVALDAHPAAAAFFETLNKTNRYAYLFRIQTVKKAETRLKRIDWAIEKLSKGEKLH
jgi:uncharacterized protein YdeI (YjbR/CyaY-like superfamily)